MKVLNRLVRVTATVGKHVDFGLKSIYRKKIEGTKE